MSFRRPPIPPLAPAWQRRAPQSGRADGGCREEGDGRRPRRRRRCAGGATGSAQDGLRGGCEQRLFTPLAVNRQCSRWIARAASTRCTPTRWHTTRSSSPLSTSSPSRSTSLEAEYVFLHPNQRPRGHVFRCVHPCSAVFTVFLFIVFTRCSEYAAQYRLPALMSAYSARRSTSLSSGRQTMRRSWGTAACSHCYAAPVAAGCVAPLPSSNAPLHRRRRVNRPPAVRCFRRLVLGRRADG